MVPLNRTGPISVFRFPLFEFLVPFRQFGQFRQLPPSLHQQFTQLTQPAAQATKKRVLHPVIGGRSSIRPHTTEVGLKPMASANSKANCAVQANRKGHPCTIQWPPSLWAPQPG